MKPTPTICIATSCDTPRREHAIGIKRSEPPATPDAPQAPRVATKLRIIATRMLTSIPCEKAAARDITVIVIAAPSILIVAPRGIATE